MKMWICHNLKNALHKDESLSANRKSLQKIDNSGFGVAKHHFGSIIQMRHYQDKLYFVDIDEKLRWQNYGNSAKY